MFASGRVVSTVDARAQAGQGSSLDSLGKGPGESPPVEIMGTPAQEPAMPSTTPPVPPLAGPKSKLTPLSPRRYSLQVTVDEETYKALKQLQDLLRHQIPNGDLAKIIKDAVLERLEHVSREKLGHTKRPRKSRQQESWIETPVSNVNVGEIEMRMVEDEKPIAEAATRGNESVQPVETTETKYEQQVKSESERESVLTIAPGRSEANSRHIPAAVKREVWERDKARCAFVSRSGRRCSEKGRLEFHHVHAYALGGPATVENIALRCRTHNAYEGAALFGEKKTGRAGANTRERLANRPGAIEKHISTNPAKNAP